MLCMIKTIIFLGGTIRYYRIIAMYTAIYGKFCCENFLFPVCTHAFIAFFKHVGQCCSRIEFSSSSSKKSFVWKRDIFRYMTFSPVYSPGSSLLAQKVQEKKKQSWRSFVSAVRTLGLEQPTKKSFVINFHHHSPEKNVIKLDS